MKLTDDLYAYPWTSMFENNCNSYLIGGNVMALVDPGLLVHFTELSRSMARDGLDTDNIKHVILTHCHPDHFEAVARFIKNDDVTIYMSAEEATFMEDIGKEFFPAFGLPIPEYRIDVYLEDGEIEIGGETFQVLITPGHSPGSACIYWPEKKALFSGDVAFSRNVGRTDFPGGDGELLKESITKISGLDAEYMLPGHMEVVVGKGNVEENFNLIKRGIFPYI